MPNAHMQFVSYVSCPYIATKHLNETIAHFTQWFVHYPEPNTVPDFRSFVEMIEDEYDIILEALDDGHDDDVPACGDCGGCCECLGDPPDCRWDTTAEMDDYYRETS